MFGREVLFQQEKRTTGYCLGVASLTSRVILGTKKSLYFQLPAKGKAIADSAYVGTPEKCTTSMDEHPPWVTHIINRALAKGENYHGRMKQFGALYQRFRSGRRTLKDRLRKHKICVDAVHVILYFELPHQPLQDV